MATSVRKSKELTRASLTGDTLVIIGDPSTGDYFQTTLDLLKAFIGAAANRQSVANTTSIPFTYGTTEVAPHTMSAPRTITPLSTGALSGNGAIQRITADGTNIPLFSGYKKSNASKDYVNTSGVVNVVLFLFDGTDYWYTIYQQASVGGVIPITPAAPTAAIVDDTADTFNWTNNPSYTSLSQLEQTLDGGATASAVTAKPIVIGNVAKAIGQVGIRVKAIGSDNPSAWLFNSTAFTNGLPQLATPSVSFDTITGNSMRLVIAATIPNATSYTMEISTVADFSSIFANSVSGSLTASFSGLSSGNTYYGRARATGAGYADSNNGTTSAATTGADTTPPVLVSAVIQTGLPTQILYTANENLQPQGTLDISKFIVKVNGSAVAIASASATNSTYGGINVTTPIAAGAVVTVSYIPGSSGVRIADAAGNFMAGFTDMAVTNNLVVAANHLTVDGNALTISGNYLVIN